MRISDWSSDVCSSDLHRARHAEAVADHHRELFFEPARRPCIMVEQHVAARDDGFDIAEALGLEGRAQVDHLQPVATDVDAAEQIGRPPWRERVGEYVSMAVVAV